MVDPAVGDVREPDPPSTLPMHERDQEVEDHPLEGLCHSDVRAEQWSSPVANTANATDQAEKCSASRDQPEHIGDCNEVQAEQWSRNAHTHHAADQAEHPQDVQLGAAVAGVAQNTLDCQKTQAELCDSAAHIVLPEDHTGQPGVATDQPEHSGDCSVDRAELWSSTMDPAISHQEQYQAEQQSIPDVQQEPAAGDLTTKTRQPLTILRAVARSVVSPITTINDPVLTSHSKGYPVADSVEMVDERGPEGCTRQAGNRDQAE